MTKDEFAELLIYHGRRRVGDEWHGRTPLQLAEQYEVPLGVVAQWLNDWRTRGFYLASRESPLEGYLTTYGRDALRAPL